MGRIILVLCLLISSVVSAQPGYTNINARYKWIAGGFDSSLILPRYNGVPSGLRSTWNTDGQLAVDTANNRLYVYSGGAWIRLANYSDVSSYTFPYSVVAPGNAIQLENDTTANPANYFYGRNSAGRRGWYPQSGIVGENYYNSNGTFTGDRTGDLNSNRLDFTNTQRFRILDFNSTERLRIAQSGVGVAIGTQYTTKLSSGLNGTSRYLLLAPDSTILTGIPYTLSTTGKKIMIRDTATGLVENIDPALIGGGGTPGGLNTEIQYNNSGSFGADSDFNYTASNDSLTAGKVVVVNKVDNINYAKIYQHSGGAMRMSLFNGDGVELPIEAGDGYLFMTGTDLVISRDDDHGNPNLMVEPTSGSNYKAFAIQGYEGEVFNITKHGSIHLGDTLFTKSGNLIIDTLLNKSNLNVIQGWDSTNTSTRGEVGYVRIGSGLSLSGGELTANSASTYNNQTGTSYTLQSSDNGKIVTLSNAGAITLTVPSSLPAGFNCTLVQLGAGQVTITPSSTTVHNRQSFTKIKGQYAAATIIMYATDTFLTQGDME